MAFKKFAQKAAKYTLPLLVVACSTGIMGMKEADDMPMPANDTTQTVKTDAATAGNVIDHETFAIKQLNITYNSGGLGAFRMNVDAQSGRKNTGTSAYRTDLNMSVVSTPLGAAHSDLQGNDAVHFTTIKFDDPSGFSDNHRAYVEFEIVPLKKMRSPGSVTATNASAFTVYPTFARNMEDVDLDSTDATNAASTQSYGINTLKFKGYVDDLRINSDMTRTGATPGNIGNAIVGISSNGLLITGISIDRKVYENSDRDTRSDERMVITPKNIFQ